MALPILLACLSKKRLRRGGGGSGTDFDNGSLPLDTGFHAVLGEFDVQVFALHVCGNRRRDVEFLDCLGPFVGKLALFFLFSCFELFVAELALRGGGKSGHDVGICDVVVRGLS